MWPFIYTKIYGTGMAAIYYYYYLFKKSRNTAVHTLLINVQNFDTTFFLFRGSMKGPLTLCLSFTKFYFDFQVYSFISVIV